MTNEADSLRRRRQWRDSISKINRAPRKVTQVRRIEPTPTAIAVLFSAGVLFGFLLAQILKGATWIP